MTIRDVIHLLLDYPMDAKVFIGRGVGPLGKVDYNVRDHKTIVYLEPAQ